MRSMIIGSYANLGALDQQRVYNGMLAVQRYRDGLVAAEQRATTQAFAIDVIVHCLLFAGHRFRPHTYTYM